MEEREKILLIDNSVSFTGALKCALTEAGLLKDQFDFVFILPTGSSATRFVESSGLKYYTLPMVEISRSPKQLFLYFPCLLTNARRVLAIVRKENIHIIQVNDFYNLLGVAVKMLGFRGRLITYVRFLPVVMPGLLRNLWLGLARRYADAIIAVSDAVLKQLPPHAKNRRIYDAVSFSEQLTADSSRRDNATRFLYLGNYIRGKGQDHALKAFKAIAALENDSELRFVGSDMGLEKNRKYKNELVQYAEDAKIADKVVFAPFSKNIEAEIKNADIVLNFSEGESFSMTCAEASFYGRPVIATKCGGPEEIIVHNQTGFLVANRDVNEMKDKMLLLVKEKETRERFGTNGAKFVREKFHERLFIRAFLSMIEEISRPR